MQVVYEKIAIDNCWTVCNVTDKLQLMDGHLTTTSSVVDMRHKQESTDAWWSCL